MRYSFSPPRSLRDGDLAVAADEAADLDGPVDLGDDGRQLRPPGLEELLGPGQAARDVLGAGRLAGDLGQDVAGEDLLRVLDLEVGPRGQEVFPEEDGPALVVGPLQVEDLDLGLELLVLGVDDDLRAQSRELVLDLFHADPADDVVEADDPALFGQDERVIGVPLGEGLPGLDLAASGTRILGPVGHLVVLDLAPAVVEDGDVGVPVDDDEGPFLVLDGLEVVELDDALVLGLELGLLGAAHGDAADVEGPHRQLGAGLADRLGGDDAAGLAELDHACREARLRP